MPELNKKHVQIAVVSALGLTALLVWLLFHRDPGKSDPDGIPRTIQEQGPHRKVLREVGSAPGRRPGGEPGSFELALEGLSLQEKNAQIVNKLMEAEFLRMKSINESESADEYTYIIEIDSPSPAELKELMRIASLAEGNVGESQFSFAKNAPKDRALKEFLLEAFFLRAGNDTTKITISASKKDPLKASYSTSTKLKGTRTRSISGGNDEPLEQSGRFGKFFEPIDK